MKKHFLYILFTLTVIQLHAQNADTLRNKYTKPPPVFVNHIFISPDDKTYNDIIQSPFIRKQFASFDERTTQSNPGESWTGSYLYGQNTYLEIYEVKKNPGLK